MAGRRGETRFDPETHTWRLDEYTIEPTADGRFSIRMERSPVHSSLSLEAAEGWIRRQRQVSRRKVELTLLDESGTEKVFTGFHAGSGAPIMNGSQKAFTTSKYFADSPEAREALMALKVAKENLEKVENELNHFRVRIPRISSKETEEINEAVEKVEEYYDMAKRGEAPPRDQRGRW